MDLFTKKIIGYSFSKNMETKLTIDALTKAYKQQRPGKDLIIHSGRGSQYISRLFRKKVKELGLVQSFSNKGNPYDNAVIESFHATLKKEEVNHKSILILKKHIDQSSNSLRVGTTKKEFIAVSII